MVPLTVVVLRQFIHCRSFLTLGSTNLHQTPVGSAMNLEFDVMGKYVARLLDAQLSARGGRSLKFCPKYAPDCFILGKFLSGALFKIFPSNNRYALSVMCKVS